MATMDRRQIKTRKAVFNAFIELLDEKGYADITIQDIIDRADIGRSTFYSHFQTKEDLLSVICEEIFLHVFAEHGEKEEHHDFSDSKELDAELTHILYHLGDHRKAIRSILSADCADTFMRYFKRNLYETVSKERVPMPQGVPEGYALHHYVSSYADTVRWWMDNEGYTPEDMIRYFKRMTIL